MKNTVIKRLIAFVLAMVLVCGIGTEGRVVNAKENANENACENAKSIATEDEKVRAGSVIGNMNQGAIQQGNRVYYSYAEAGKPARVFAYNVKTGKTKVVLKINAIGCSFSQFKYYNGFLYACLVDRTGGDFTLYRTNLKTGKIKKLGEGFGAIIYKNRILYNYCTKDGNIVTKSMKLNGKDKKTVFNGIVLDLAGKWFYAYHIDEDAYYRFDVNGKHKKQVSLEDYTKIYSNQKYYTSETKYYQNVYLERDNGLWVVKIGKYYYYTTIDNPFLLNRENIKTGKKEKVYMTNGVSLFFEQAGDYLMITLETGGIPELYLTKMDGTVVKKLR